MKRRQPNAKRENVESFRDKRVLITGGLGFIGSNLARRLVGLGAHVTLMDSLIPASGGNHFNISDIEGKVRLNISDVRDEHSVKDVVQDKDFLFNLAGQTSHLDSMQDPYTDLEINLRGQLHILEACRALSPDAKIIFTSTRQLYGKPKYMPVDESHPINCPDVNAVHKLAAEWHHLLYNNVYGLRACVLRLTNTYGPGMRIRDARQMFVGIWIRQLLEGKPITVYGDGSQVRDFNYVEDVVEALLLAVASDRTSGQVFNLGAEQPLSLRDLAVLMVEVHGSGGYTMVPFQQQRKTIDIGDYHGDYSKIRAVTGWEPRMPLRDGLARTLAYYQQHREQYL